jgi:hypothetical protein
MISILLIIFIFLLFINIYYLKTIKISISLINYHDINKYLGNHQYNLILSIVNYNYID